MKVSTKLAAAFALHVALLAVLLAYHVRTIRHTVTTARRLGEISSRIHATSTKQLGRIEQLEENVAKYWVTRDEGYVDKLRQLQEDHTAELRQLAALPIASPERAAVGELTTEWNAFMRSAVRLPDAMAGPPAAARDSVAQLQAALERLRLRTQRVSEASQGVMAERLERSALTAREAERLSLVAATGALLSSILISVLIVRSISQPLRRLTEGTRAVAAGRFDHRLQIGRADEFAQLARDFNTMTARLGELDRVKRDFVSQVSHDLKTPLASMHETIDVVLDEVPGPLTAQQRHLLELNRESAVRLSSMLAKLLDLSRLESGPAASLQVADMPGVIRQALAGARVHAAERGLQLTARSPEGELLLECDADRIRQLLDNLLENALKFSPPGGEVCVELRSLSTRPQQVPLARWRPVMARVREPAAVAHLSVQDQGPGVADEEKERVFDRFHQTEAGRRVRGRGVGLGLAICREIVTTHGGSIWMADRPGGGAVVNVLLPGALAGAMMRGDATATVPVS